MNTVFSDDSAHLSAQLVFLLYAFARLVGGKAKGNCSFGVEYKILRLKLLEITLLKA